MTDQEGAPEHGINLPDPPKIVRNSARCLSCGDEVESRHLDDFVACTCGALAVDGGRAYLRRVYNGPYEDTSVQDTSVQDTSVQEAW